MNPLLHKSMAHRSSSDRAGGLRPEPAAQSQPKALIPCADCADGSFPLYGVAPHECFWRKGPEFTLGQSTLVPFSARDCFVPDLNQDEDWSAFVYPSACGIYYCPNCHGAEYRAVWARLIARIGPPPADVATCEHGAPS